MMLPVRISLLVFFLTSLHLSSYSQQRCATVEYEQLRLLQNPAKEKTTEFEQWMGQQQQRRKMAGQSDRPQAAPYIIPVVVHIIHNGEAIGTGTNLSDAQVFSQIRVLNEDFKRLNADAANTPAEFQPVAGGFDVTFVLAKRDPYGLPTNGISRVQGTQTSWGISDNTVLKSLSYWPAEDYLNIWVLNVPEFLGYAQFPVSNIGGLENSSEDRLTDGVVIHYTAFGSSADGAFSLNARYNLGRTTSHEVGHFFGLRHIWGDDGTSCAGSDFVDDTPNQGGSSLGLCPNNTRNTCADPGNDMFVNYMDYTDDACLNMFTLLQIDRMITVMESSPRRASLLTSTGATVPPALSLDLSLREITTPREGSCGGTITPAIQIQNLGSTTITSARIRLKVNSVVTETKDFALSLANGQIATASFQSLTQPAGTSAFEYEILLVNGGADQLAANNTKSITSLIPPSGTLPVNEVFTSIPASWTIHNPDNLKTWQLRSTPGHGNAMFVNCYDYDNEGTIDRLITPVYDLTDVTVAFLRFERAHAIYNASQIERLKVIVTDACNFTSQSVVIFNKSGSSLATASATQSAFVPTSTQWTTETFSLNQFTGRKIQIAFEATNGFGNNIYLDNVSIIADEFVDGALVSVESPSPVSCVTNVTPVVRVKNMGGTTLESFRIEAVINGTTTLSKSFSGLSITSGEEQTVSFNPVFLVAGNNNIVFTLAEPNGILDSNEADNTLTVRRVVNTAGNSIPLRQNFEGNFQNQWTTVSQGTQEAWTTANTNKGKSLVYSAFDNPNLGDESWFVSPVLDFSKAAQASLFFDISYGKRAQGSEQLKVFYSTDCGITFSDMIFEQFGSFLSTATSVGAWVPATDNQWKREYLNLSSLAGSDNMRFAFVAKADNGNNLYVDNIEFFIDDDPFPVSIADQYSVYGGGGEAKITFKLTERQPVQLTVYNTMGQVLVSNELPETLNQTYSVKLSQASGIYIFKLQIGSVVSATKVYLE